MAYSTFTSQPNLNHLWASLLIEELVRQGVTFFCISPGSRSTPLTLAAANHPEAEVFVHVDERGSAFMALGYGRATGSPAAVITTSGTAVANVFPAVVEAANDYVPLLLLTADRPPELRSTGANQTIDQVKIFGSYVRWEMDLPTPSVDVRPNMILTTAGQAVYRTMDTPAGPVHLNCMFRKPLAPVPEMHDFSTYLSPIESWVKANEPYTKYQPGIAKDSGWTTPGVPDGLSTSRGVIVAGTLTNKEDQSAALRLAEEMKWPLLADIRSGLRLGRAARSSISIPYVDQILTCEPFKKAHPPDVVVHLGGRIVSKRLQSFIAAADSDVHLLVRPESDRLDASHHLTHCYGTRVCVWVDALLQNDLSAGGGSWMEKWRAANDVASGVISRWKQEADQLSEPLVARLISENIPENHGLFVANSMPVRDINRYASSKGFAVRIGVNRGASGIDGTVSSAVGFGRGRDRAVTLLLGDLALLHDINALGMLRHHPVVAVVVNNDGGGIFHFLPVAEHATCFEPYFGTPHGRSFEDAAGMFDVAYVQPTSPSEFKEAYADASRSGQSALIEVRTDRNENAAVHRDLEADIAAAVSRTV